MANTAEQKQDPRRLGALGWAIFIVFLLFLTSAFMRGCSRPYWRAMWLKEKDPCTASALFAADVRSDARESISSLYELAGIGSPCALRELIALMDLPDGQHVDKAFRRVIRAEIKKWPALNGIDRPPYDPDAPIEIRTRQMRAWQQWFDHTYGRHSEPVVP